MYNTTQKKQTPIHHDYENATYWGAPSFQTRAHKLTLILDIRYPFVILTSMLAEYIKDGEYCEELRNQVIRHTCNCLVVYAQQENSLTSTTNENTNKAIQCLMDYGIQEIVASRIFHETETLIIKCLMNIVPDIDDERKYRILNHKIVNNEDLHLTLEVIND